MQKIKGTKDWFGYEAKLLATVQKTFNKMAKNFNYQYIEFPIIDNVELFKRSSGETSDIVSKEMYVFQLKSGKEIALRPEGTAPFVRCLQENKLMHVDRFNKYYYFGPMFRYEQPQKGRYRQFTQLGIENVSEINPYTDAETILFGAKLLESLNIKQYKLIINNIGTIEERNNYSKVLRDYLLKFKDELEEDSINRLDKNVMRILDDKKEQVKDFITKCPKIHDYVSSESTEYFNKIKSILLKNNIKFEIDSNLVRGLDYYQNIVFEFISTSEALGSQSAIIAGGRYANFLKGDIFESAIGWAAGIERIIEILKFNNYEISDQLVNLVVVLNDSELDEAFGIAQKLRENESTEIILQTIKLNKAFKLSNAIHPKYLVFKDTKDGVSKWIKKDQATSQIIEI